ncbi:MAG: hypothetical protein ACKVUT_09745 [Gaiella sp.]
MRISGTGGDPRTAPAVALAAGVVLSTAAGAMLAEPELGMLAVVLVVAALVCTAALAVPLHLLVLGLVATLPFADWQPPGSPVSISVLAAMTACGRALVEVGTLRPLQLRSVGPWLALPLLLVPSAFSGAAGFGGRAQLFFSMASWLAIALLVGHFLTESRWPLIRAVLVAEVAIAVVIAAAELVAQRWLVPFPDPPQTQVEFFFGFFRPRSITLSPYALGEFLAFTAPIVWYQLAAAFRRDRGRLPLWLMLTAGQLAIIVATLSRKSLWQLGVAIAVFLVASLADRRARRSLLPVAVALAVAVVAAVTLNGPALGERLRSSTSAEGVSLRVDTFNDALTIGTSTLPLGAGLGNFVATSTDRYGEQLAAYNSFAEAFADSGLLGLAVVLLLVAIPFRLAAAAPAVHVPPRAVVLATMAGLVALAAVESSIWRKSLAFSAGLCLAVAANARAARTQQGATAR